ncbi:MAG: hypothetical protein OEM39_09635 [Acidimicrobiia bacterium]|nr:hypothetical protein [Acidimicrobiia bacterium]MDH3464091.1 hypothetical protein [Acidimicrobiia bacterium]
MSDQFHVGTFLWGAVLAVAGVAMAAIGFGWWDAKIGDLGIVAPVILIAAGAAILFGALTRHPDQGAGSHH